ncbi:hypothetical protein PMIN07_003842 [Paraphaeosphaeria minitans]
METEASRVRPRNPRGHYREDSSSTISGDSPPAISQALNAAHLTMSEREHQAPVRAAGEPVGDEPAALSPPLREFRVVKDMYEKESSAEWLCLPRALDATAAVEEEETKEEPPAHLFRPDSSADIPRHDTSVGERLHRKARAQLVVVRMYESLDALRNESDTLNMLHDREGQRSEDFIGPLELHACYSIPTDSWLCLPPIFGKSLEAFGQACLDTNRIPAYFVWHVFIRLMSAVQFVHAAGIAHGDLSSANVMIRLPDSPEREWPDVILTGFEVEVNMDLYEDERREDVKRMAGILYTDVISQWSDSAMLMRFIDFTLPQADPLMDFAAELKTIVDARLDQYVDLEDFEEWKSVAISERARGPGYCPAWIKTAAYDVLVTDKELEKAMRPPLVLRFGPGSERFKRWARARRMPVALRTPTGGPARFGLLVIKFKIRKGNFASLIGT